MVFSENFFGSGASPDNPSGPGGGPPKPGPQYPIGTSLRFRGKATDANTPKLSNANITCPTTFTYSAWCKFPQRQPAADGYATLFNQDGSGGSGKGPNLWLTTSTNGTSNFTYYVNAGAATGYSGTPQFNDPSAWYHIVFTSPSNTLYVNGVAYYPQGDLTLTDIDSVPFQIGSGFEAESWIQMDMILTDIYFIDGQELSPTVFAEYNEIDVWTPIQPDFGKGGGGRKYSNHCAGYAGTYNPTSTEQTYEEAGPTGLFDGKFNTLCQAKGSGTINVNFKPALTNVTGLRLYVGHEERIYINETLVIDRGTNNGGGTVGWVDLTAYIPAGNEITQIAYGDSGADSTSARAAAIEVNGQILLDPNQWSGQLERLDGTTPTNFTNVGQAFDGDTSTSANGGANQHCKFAPTPGIPFNEKIEVWLDGPAGVPWYFWGDGNDQPSSPGGSSTLDQWTTIYEGSGVIDADHMISGGAVGTGWSLSGIRVDGKVIVDGVNSSFGETGFHLEFKDPNDPGKDTSGNGNHFTANGDFDFVLKRSGDYADPTTTNYDQATNSVPTANGGPAYIIDVVDSGNSGTWCTYNPSGWSNGVVAGPGNDNGTYVGESYAQSFTFDLRDFDTVESVVVYTGWNQPGTGGNMHAELLDSSKNLIPGTRVNTQRNNNGSAPYTLCSSDVGARYIRFDCSASDSSTFLYGIEVNGGMIYQGDDFNPQYDLLLDSPTNNLPSFNPLWPQTEQNIFSGNLAITTATLTGGQANIRFPVGITGKYYFEAFTYNTPKDPPPALVLTDQLNADIVNNDGIINQANYSVITDQAYSNFSDTSGTSYSFNSNPIRIHAFAIDFDNQEVRFYVNGELINTDTTVNFNSELAINVQQPRTSYNTYQPSINFGQYDFYYEIPDGFTTLMARNLEDGDIANGREHFQVVTGPGTGGASGGRQGTWMSDLFTLNTAGATRADAHVSTQAIFHQSNIGLFAFDGNTGTVAETSQAEGRPAWMSFRPSDTSLPELTANTSFKIRMRRIAEVWVNGTQLTGDFNGGNVTYDLSSQLTFPFTLESLEIKSVDGQDVGLFGIELDNQWLVQQGILEAAQQTFPNGLWWIKDRAANFNHQLIDHVRGELALQSNTPQVEQAYSVPGDSVAWCWKAGDSIVTNNDGTIETQVSANTKAGFSIVTYTGNLTAGATIGHGLSQRPEFFMVKARNFSQDWHVGAPWIIGAANSLLLNKVNEIANYNAWNGAPPDDSVITLGPVDGTNKSGEEYVAYCWHNVPGYCKIAPYYGNGDTFGPFNHTGFKPAFVMIKATGNAGFGWFMNDTTRKPYNPMSHPLTADSSAAEGNFSSALPNFLSNGFRLRGGSDQYNKVGQQYLYIAFAENPFSASVTAR